jgi:hypothetical protein
MTKNRRRVAGRRRGISLIETIVLMSGVAAMLGLTVLVLQLLLKLDADSRSRLDRAGALERLAEDFRRDAHRARIAKLIDQPPRPSSLRLEFDPGRLAEYQVTQRGELVRLESSNGKPARRESYAIVQGGSIELALKDIDKRRFAVISVDRKASKYRTDPPRIFEVMAHVGRYGEGTGGAAVSAGGLR